MLLETLPGLVLLPREQLRVRVRSELDGAELLVERRRAAESEDAA
jgi:hypothetical protein